jgi:tRNA pseudouridine synthase D (truD)
VLAASNIENEIVSQHSVFAPLMKQEKMKAARRPLLMKAKAFSWAFEPEGLRLKFYLPAGSYATALVRELVNYTEA